MLEQDERLHFSNIFGSVSDKRIVLNHKNGSEEIPKGQITSVSFQKVRNLFMSIFSFLFSIILISYMIVVINSGSSEGGIIVLITSVLLICKSSA
jgi:hypothetical protein